MSCTIVGVDLMPIRAIPNVITHAEDITGGKVRQLLQKDLAGQKVCGQLCVCARACACVCARHLCTCACVRQCNCAIVQVSVEHAP